MKIFFIRAVYKENCWVNLNCSTSVVKKEDKKSFCKKRIHQLKKYRQFQENLSFFNSVDIIILGIVLYWCIYIYICLSYNILKHFSWYFEEFEQSCFLPGPSWLWYGSWIYNYLCNQCLSPLTFWVRIPSRWGVLNTIMW